LLKTISKSSVCDSDWIRTTGHYRTIIGCLMRILAIVMATCSYQIYFWRMGGNQLA